MRRNEVACGLLLILISFSFVASLLLDFTFVSAFASPREDLSYLSENVSRQFYSTLSWFITAVLIALVIPFYLMVFKGRLRIFHYINALIMLVAVLAFVLMSQQGLILYREMEALLGMGLEQADEASRISLLNHYQQAQWFRHLASSAVGIWALGLGASRIKVRRIPLMASLLYFLSPPLLIYFNWTDPDHLLRTAAMTGIVVGTLIFSVRLVNRGLEA